MEKNFDIKTLAQAGSDIVEILLGYVFRDNDGNSFLRNHLSDNEASKKYRDALNKFSESGKKIQDSAEKIVESTVSSEKQLENINEMFGSMSKTMDKLRESSKSIDEKLNDLKSQIKKIDEFVNNIQNISNQTNLLSFNASIEAARAGQAGRGFRIIANEVKKLSGNTNVASQEIAKEISKLDSQIAQVVEENRSHNEYINKMQTSTKESAEILTEIGKITEQNVNFTNEMCEEVRNNQKNIMLTSAENEKMTLAQIKTVTKKFEEETFVTGDRISFLIELKKLFEYIQMYAK